MQNPIRNLNHLQFTSLKKALAKLPVQNAILDGEIVFLDKNGVSRFYQLLHGKAEPVFMRLLVLAERRRPAA